MWIENEYRAIKQEFLARTSSTNHELRIYYFVFGILMYNVWRLADVLLKTTVTREIADYTPAITAGELADWLAIHLQAEPNKGNQYSSGSRIPERQLSADSSILFGQDGFSRCISFILDLGRVRPAFVHTIW